MECHITPIFVEDLLRLVMKMFISVGVSPKAARQAADVIVAAERRGIPSHGVRTLRSYIEGIKSGAIYPNSALSVEKETFSTALLDGGNGLGQIAATQGMKMCIAKAAKSGSSIVAIKRSNHFGIAGYYALMAVNHNMIGLAMTNAPPRVGIAGSEKAVLGTNPLAVAIPIGFDFPFVLDMATSVRSFGQIKLFADYKLDIPSGWVISKEGNSITDANEAVSHGILLPLGGGEKTGGYKGIGLGMMVDLLCGPLLGGSFGEHIVPLRKAFDQHSHNVGHLFMSWDISAFQGIEQFLTDARELILDYKKTARASEIKPFLVPGEKEYLHLCKVEKTGLALDCIQWQGLRDLAEEIGVDDPLLI